MKELDRDFAQDRYEELESTNQKLTALCKEMREALKIRHPDYDPKLCDVCQLIEKSGEVLGENK